MSDVSHYGIPMHADKRTWAEILFSWAKSESKTTYNCKDIPCEHSPYLCYPTKNNLNGTSWSTWIAFEAYGSHQTVLWYSLNILIKGNLFGSQSFVAPVQYYNYFSPPPCPYILWFTDSKRDKTKVKLAHWSWIINSCHRAGCSWNIDLYVRMPWSYDIHYFGAS